MRPVEPHYSNRTEETGGKFLSLSDSPEQMAHIFIAFLLLGATHHPIRSALELVLPPRAAHAPGSERCVYAVGDVHGDADALLALLRAAGVADAKGRWVAGDSVLIQTGDLFDRHANDLEPFRLLRCLRRGAREAGGDVAWLLGNHEALNAIGHFACVPPEGYAPFDRLMRRYQPGIDFYFDALDAAAKKNAPYTSDVPIPVERHARARRLAMAPGGLVARALAAPVALVVGDTLFVHGGVRLAHVPFLAEWNAQIVDWLRGQRRMPPEALGGADSPLWTRRLSLTGVPGSELPAEVCGEVESVLRATGCARIVVGHTPQPLGCNCACGGRVWRVDTGMSSFYGGRPELLRIDGSSGEVTVCALAARGGTAAAWLPASARMARAQPTYAPDTHAWAGGDVGHDSDAKRSPASRDALDSV